MASRSKGRGLFLIKRSIPECLFGRPVELVRRKPESLQRRRNADCDEKPSDLLDSGPGHFLHVKASLHDARAAPTSASSSVEAERL